MIEFVLFGIVLFVGFGLQWALIRDGGDKTADEQTHHSGCWLIVLLVVGGLFLIVLTMGGAA